VVLLSAGFILLVLPTIPVVFNFWKDKKILFATTITDMIAVAAKHTKAGLPMLQMQPIPDAENHYGLESLNHSIIILMLCKKTTLPGFRMNACQ
jgi:hypothetical protein